MVGLRRAVWLAVTVWFAACGGRTDPLEEDADSFTVGGQRASGGSAGRGTSGGKAGWQGRQGGASFGGAVVWPTGGRWWPTGGSWPWYGGYGPGSGGWRTGGAGPGYGGYGARPTGGFGPSYGGWPPGAGGAPNRGGVAGTIDGGPPDGPPPPTDGGIPWDALPLPDGGPVADCVICARDRCSAEIDACVATSVCLGGILCAVIQCQAGQYDCMLACFGNDITALTAGINAATCMVTQCGANCVTAFGGLL